MAGPLSGVTIIEAASVITGPWAASLLADQGARVVIADLPGLLDLVAAHGTSLVMVTHDAELAGAADRVLHLHDGRLVEDPE